jgi:hypothetical protein
VYAESTSRPGKCQTYAERIEAKVHLGLTAQRIYQDLVIEVGFKGSYQAVKRFVPRLKESSPTPKCFCLNPRTRATRNTGNVVDETFTAPNGVVI